MAEKKRNGNSNLPILSPPRLPYHPAVKERFGYDKSDWKALCEAIFPVAQTPESVILALSYCKARKLDPFKRCVHIVPIYDKAKGCMVDTIWPGIGEVRTTAHRTGLYAGRDKTEFGDDETKTWEGRTKGQYAKDYKITVTFPAWAQVTVYRIVKGKRVAYAGPQVYWVETFSANSGGAPNSMWENRPRGQIDKCAEAAALRAAFPEEVGNEYIDSEAHLPEARHVESTVVEKGIKGLKDRLEERDAATETQTESGAEEKPADDTERDAETEAKVQEQKESLGVDEKTDPVVDDEETPADDDPNKGGTTAAIF